MTIHENERLARRLLTGFTTGQWDPSLFARDATSWHNHDQVEASLAAGAEQLGTLQALIPDLAPQDLRVHGFDGGFVVELTWTGTLVDGTALRAPVCIAGTVVDGRITSLREYLDSTHFAPLFAAAAGGASS